MARFFSLVLLEARFLGACFLGACALGCQSGAPEKRGEFSRIGKAIDDVRLAENTHKAPQLERLAAASCSHFCELRDSCVFAYERHLGALSLIEEAKSADARTGMELLARAESSLKTARDLTEECAALQGALSRKWGR